MPTDTIAAIDLGSNSFHMIVTRIVDGQVQVIDRLKEMVQLAAGLDEQQRLSEEAGARALACLARFGQRLRHIPGSRVRIVGTNTLRQARNGSEFLAAAEGVLGHPVEVISGIEEARLIYLGVAHSTANGEGRRLVVDIGGGSTELIIGERFEPLHLESLYMGCVSMSRRFFADGKIRRADLQAAGLAVRVEMEPIVLAYRALGWQQAIGASGTVKAMHDVVVREGWSHDGITRAALQQLRDALCEAGSITGLAQRWDLSKERASVFAGGFAVLHGVCESLGIEHVRVSDGALREGLIYDLLGRLRHEDVRDRTIAALIRRYGLDAAQGERVAATALGLLAQVRADWRLEDEELAQYLAWAGRLHEIGLVVAHSQHHKHGAYVLQHSDLPGFSGSEQALLAALVRGHRRKLPTPVFETLPNKAIRAPAQRLCVLLRLAVVLHRSRRRKPLPDLRLQVAGPCIELWFPAGWLEDRPLTRADLETEARYLEAAGLRLHFAAMTG